MNEDRGLAHKTHHYENLACSPTSSSPTLSQTIPSPVSSQHTIPIAHPCSEEPALHDMGAAHHHRSLQEMVILLVRELGKENRKTLNSTVTTILDNQKVLPVQTEDSLEEKFERWYQRFQGQACNSNQELSHVL